MTNVTIPAGIETSVIMSTTMMERTIDMTTSMAESTGGGMPSWAWIPIILGVAAIAGLIAYFMCCGGEKAPKKKKKKVKRAVKAEPEAVPAASATASTVR